MTAFTQAQRTATALTLLSSVLLSACSESGTVTTLDANPSITIGLPQVLQDSPAIDKSKLHPTIQLSNGASVSMQQGAGDSWTGTINVATGNQYTATVTWVENVNEVDVPLAQLTQQLQVAADGSVVRSAETEYSTDIDSDADGLTNLEERENGTNPFEPEADMAANDDADTARADGSNNVAALTGTQDETDPVPSTNTGEGGNDNANPDNDDTGNTTDSEDGGAPGNDSNNGVSNTADNTQPDDTDTGIDVDSNSNGSSDQAASGINGSDNGSVPDQGSDGAVEPVDDVVSDPVVSEPTVEETSTSEDELPVQAEPDPVVEPAIVEAVTIMADLVVPRIAASAAPTINGKGLELLGINGELVGEWAAAVQTDNSGAPLYINNLLRANNADESDGSPYRRWAAMHDGINLYILVLADDDGNRHRDSGASLDQDDSLELFLDGDNSKSQSYDANDFSRLFPLQLAGVDKQTTSTGDVAGSNSSTAALSINFATGPGIGPDGIRRRRYEMDVYEIQINLASAGIDVDKPFGFELQINDDDNGGSRNSRWAWKQASDTAPELVHQNPSLMGTLVLE